MTQRGTHVVVTFLADNSAGHPRAVIVRPQSPESLPTGAQGAVDESQLEEGDLVGEIKTLLRETSAAGTSGCSRPATR